MTILGRALGFLRAKAFLQSLGHCEWPECPNPKVALPQHSLFKCGCGCGRTMSKACVIKHNLAISRIQQTSAHMTKEMKARAW